MRISRFDRGHLQLEIEAPGPAEAFAALRSAGWQPRLRQQHLNVRVTSMVSLQPGQEANVPVPALTDGRYNSAGNC
jgi:hypothetical protein